jgi:hypothetical protein
MSEAAHLLSNVDATPAEVIAAEEARLAVAPLEPRRKEILAALEKVQVEDDEDMRRAMDKIAIARAVRDESDVKLDPVGKPYRDSAHAVRQVALQFTDPLKRAEDEVQRRISAYRGRQREAAAAAAEAQRIKEAELREKAGLAPDPAAAAPIRPADIRLGSSRSDYRAQAFDRKIVHVRIINPRLLPDEVLNSPGVTEALERAVRRLAGLTKTIPGAEVTDDQATSVKVK